jgi:hypothetical protein
MGHAGQIWTMRYAYKISVGKSEVERSRHRQEYNIKMGLKETRCRQFRIGSGGRLLINIVMNNQFNKKWGAS